MTATWSILTPRAGRGAIAIIRLRGADIPGTMRRIGIAPVGVGQARLRDLLGVDEGVAARWDDHTLDLMPHGGQAVLRRLVAQLTEFGIEERNEQPQSVATIADIPRAAASAIAHAASPLAIDLLLGQHARWQAVGLDAADLADGATLSRLIDPPLVAAIGPANIGKSTLANALAGEAVALVADVPGTTRDHVGLTLDLAGLTVRYLDTPGVRKATGAAGDIEREAVRRALAAASAADLILLCGDAASPPIDPGELGAGLAPPCGTVRVALRADLGTADWPHDISLAVVPRQPESDAAQQGIAALASLIRERLVPRSVLTDARPWRFWAG